MTLVTAPELEPLTLEETKKHLKVTFTEEDVLIATIITAVRQAWEMVSGMALLQQTWEAAYPCFPWSGGFVLPRPPLLSVTSVTYIDENGAPQTLAASEYTVDTRAFPGELVPAYNKTWPSTREVPNAVVIKYVAGYGDEEADVPEPIRAALRLEAGTHYYNREELSTAAGQNVTPTTLGVVRAIMANYRAYVV